MRGMGRKITGPAIAPSVTGPVLCLLFVPRGPLGRDYSSAAFSFAHFPSTALHTINGALATCPSKVDAFTV